jgi:hypothetical protein
MGAIRANITSAYDSAWRNWADLCMVRDSDPKSNDLIVITAFLAEQSRSKSYSTINVYRSALSATLEKVVASQWTNHQQPSMTPFGMWIQCCHISRAKKMRLSHYVRWRKKLATLLATLFRASDSASVNFIV